MKELKNKLPLYHLQIYTVLARGSHTQRWSPLIKDSAGE